MSKTEPARAVDLTRFGTAIVFSVLLASCGGAPEPPAESSADTIRILSYNIHHGEGMDSVIDLARIAALIRDADPDLVALQEVDSVTERTNRVDQAAELGGLTGLDHRYGSFMPYRGGAYGMAILSRLSILGTTNLRLPDGEEPRTSLAVTVELPVTGGSLTFVGIHFYETQEERLAQALSLEEQLGRDADPTILAGDFNSRPGSVVMQRLGAGWRIVEKGEDSFTFPSWAPDHEIDFVLLRPEARFQILSQTLLDEPVASDHRAVLVELVVVGGAAGTQNLKSPRPSSNP